MITWIFFGIYCFLLLAITQINKKYQLSSNLLFNSVYIVFALVLAVTEILNDKQDHDISVNKCQITELYQK